VQNDIVLRKLKHPVAWNEMPKVLLVEDDPEVRAVLDELLSLEGIKVLPAKDGQEAWELLNQKAADTTLRLVLSDITMPKINGYELMRMIRSDSRFEKLPIILTSGNSDHSETREKAGALDLKPDAFFAKPFNFPELTTTIRRLIERPN
jgi:CheY-like chemotaxis protein